MKISLLLVVLLFAAGLLVLGQIGVLVIPIFFVLLSQGHKSR